MLTLLSRPQSKLLREQSGAVTGLHIAPARKADITDRLSDKARAVLRLGMQLALAASA
jgi:hypothetical protein